MHRAIKQNLEKNALAIAEAAVKNTTLDKPLAAEYCTETITITAMKEHDESCYYYNKYQDHIFDLEPEEED